MSQTLRCISPIDGAVVAERPVLDCDAALAAVMCGRAAQHAWAARPLEERVAVVRAGVERLAADNDAVVLELARMMGRPVRYGGEIAGVIERAAYMADIAADALAPVVAEDSPAFSRRILREPVGLVLVIAPWNYPYLTAINTIAPALIAGNAVILKHATQTLLAGERLSRAFVAAGVPADVIQTLFLDHATTEDLIRRRCFGFVNFTGSVEAGRMMERAAAGGFTPLGLELGGKDPAYVMPDADLDAAAATLIDGAMFNSGQCCCGIERIYVHADIYDDFLERAVAEAQALRLGDPLDPDMTLGPMATARGASLARSQVEAALAAGATGHVARAEADDGAQYVSPQVLTGVTHDMAVMRDETFGPVVGVMRVKHDEQALALMNDSPYGLTAALWTADAERAARLAPRIQAGTVFMNRCDYLDPALCWTGVKDTGRGAALSHLGYHSVTRPKSLHFRKSAA
jgi:acyl-CoA reductase-like NAD-dependent aldehyde dehydrogenase